MRGIPLSRASTHRTTGPRPGRQPAASGPETHRLTQLQQRRRDHGLALIRIAAPAGESRHGLKHEEAAGDDRPTTQSATGHHGQRNRRGRAGGNEPRQFPRGAPLSPRGLPRVDPEAANSPENHLNTGFLTRYRYFLHNFAGTPGS